MKPPPAIAVAGLNHAFGVGEAQRQVLFDVALEIRKRQLIPALS